MIQRPLHLAISEKLRHLIAAGELQPGEQLPSEHQLMSEYEVSRITARRAIANLVSQGLVISQQGKGVFVKEQCKVTYSLSSPLVFFEQDVARQGASSSLRNLVFEQTPAPVAVQQALQLSSASPEVYLQKKLLLIDGAPVGIDVTYLIAPLGDRFAADLQQQMTFPTLEANGVPIERIEAAIECTRADLETSQYLDVPLGDPLLVYRYTAYTLQNQPIVCGEALSRGDRLCYSVVITKTSP